MERDSSRIRMTRQVDIVKVGIISHLGSKGKENCSHQNVVTGSVEPTGCNSYVKALLREHQLTHTYPYSTEGRATSQLCFVF